MTRPARERRFHLITDVSSPRRHRTTSDGFMLFPRSAYGRSAGRAPTESIGLCATTRPTTPLANALNGPIYHGPTLIRLRPPLLPLLRLSKFTFLAASLGRPVVSQIDHCAADMRARGRRKNLPVGRQVGCRTAGVASCRPGRALFRRAVEQRRC